MTRRQLLGRLRDAPGMFGLDGTYAMYVAFLWGYDVALGGEWLSGFTTWLTDTLGYGRNLGWQSLVQRSAFPDTPDLWRPFGPWPPEADAELCRTLFRLLDDYEAVAPQPQG